MFSWCEWGISVTFDSNLTWKNHINELCSKLSKTVGIFSKLRYNVNFDILIMLYYSLIYPFLICGVQVWGLTYPTYLKPVTTFLKQIARIMTFSELVSHSEPLFKSLNLFKFNPLATRVANIVPYGSMTYFLSKQCSFNITDSILH